MGSPATSLFSSGADAAGALPPLQWGWLALVAGVHLAGLAWLAGEHGSEPAQVRPQADTVVSIQLLAPAMPAPAATPPPALAVPVEAQPETAPAPPPRVHAPPRPPRATPARAPEPAEISLPQTPPATDTHPPSDVHPAPEPAAAQAPLASLAAPTTAPALPATETLIEARYDAAYLHNPPPTYPALARRRGEEGQVVLRVRVLADGRAAEVEVAQSSNSPRLDQAARQAVAGWRFEPARRGDRATESWLRVPIVFRLEGR